jgi:tungstate transport system permease protein
MHLVWTQLREAISLIARGDPYLISLLWVTVKVALISTASALIIGLPIGLTIGVGRFRGRRTLQILANVSMGLPPVVVGVVVLLLLLPGGAFGSLRIEYTIRALYVVQTILALPYIVALTPAAIQGLPRGLIEQARALGARRLQLAALAAREAKIGILAGVIAAVGATVSEVGAVIIVGGNFQGHDQTLAGALLSQFTDTANDPTETAIALMLLGLILVLLGGLSILQQYAGGIRMRFVPAAERRAEAM